jgi:hypothetical protein
VPEDILGPVAVVTVRVDDGDPLRSIVSANIIDHHGFDIHVAEAPGAVDHLHGMVSRGADQSEGVVHFPLEDHLGRLDGAARGNEVRIRGDSMRIGDADMGPVDIFRRGNAGLYSTILSKSRRPSSKTWSWV